LPMILGSDRSKLSKRHGAVGVADYKKDGYLPEALVNFMAFLGWNPGGEREIYAIPSLIKEFSLEGVQKGGAVFNVKKLDFLNSFYIRQKSVEKLTELCLPYLIETGLITPGFKTKQYPPAYGGQEIVQEYKITQTGEEITLESLQKIVSIYKERLKKLSEISELTDFFFRDKLEYDKNLLKWGEMMDKKIEVSLDKSEKILSKIKTIEEWNKENLENVLIPEAEKFAKELSKAGDRGYLLWPLRVSLTGKQSSAGPFEIAEILGKEKTIKRIIRARDILRARPST
jgi:nondiscriminating glutamyl-tRNA synthetase